MDRKKLDMWKPHAIYEGRTDPPEFLKGFGYALPKKLRKRL